MKRKKTKVKKNKQFSVSNESEVIAMCRAEITRNPENLESYALLAIIYQSQENFYEVGEILSIAYTKNPTGLIAILKKTPIILLEGFDESMELSLCFQKRFEDAYLGCSEGIKNFSKPHILNLLSATILIQLEPDLNSERYQDSIKYLDTADCDSLDKGLIPYLKGNLYLNLQDFNKALECFNEILVNNNSKTDFIWELIESLYMTGDLVNALKHIFDSYDKKDDVAIELVEKYNFKDLRDDINTSTEINFMDLNAKIGDRISLVDTKSPTSFREFFLQKRE